MIILIFFLAHWFLSLFSQTFFLHRYSSHKMFKMEPFWEKFFYLVLLISQGSSFLNPRAYAILHRMHHAYSDTEKDPHSPHFFKDVFGMMIATKNMYMNYLHFKIEPEPAFRGNYPEWPVVDRIGDSWILENWMWFVLHWILHHFCQPLVDVFIVADPLFDGTFAWSYCKLVRT
ncbi:hypothetical protein [Pedobacter sp. UC225_65]|uniref:hypothetical protein n=1 Tax=Pedobacter sp. UC225_65 TaxID=3350173 RepID=UPI00366C95D7